MTESDPNIMYSYFPKVMTLLNLFVNAVELTQ